MFSARAAVKAGGICWAIRIGAVTEGDRPSSTVKSAVGPPVELAISNISGASLDSRRSSMVLAGASGAFLRPRG